MVGRNVVSLNRVSFCHSEQRADWVVGGRGDGENVSYTYGSLDRLIAAATSGTTSVQWGDSYGYHGFGASV